MQWAYKGLNRYGARVDSELQAETPERARAMLESQGIVILQLKSKLSLPYALWRPSPLKPSDLLSFFQQALYLSQSGLSIPQWLQSMIVHHQNHPLHTPLQDMRHQILKGVRLSQAITTLNVDDLVQNLILQGEKTGRIHMAFQAVVDYLTWRIHWRHKWFDQARYPLMLCVILVVMLMVFSLVLAPEWVRLFTVLDIPMGWGTKCILWCLQGVPWLVSVLCSLGMMIWGYAWISRRSWGSLFSLYLPVIRDLWHRRALHDWLNMMTISLRGDIPLLDSVMLCEERLTQVCGGYPQNVHLALKQGVSFSNALSRVLHLPRSMILLIQAAEQGHHLVPCFEALTRMCAHDLERLIHKRISLLEPCVLGILGMIISTLVIGLLYPLYQSTGYGGF